MLSINFLELISNRSLIKGMRAKLSLIFLIHQWEYVVNSINKQLESYVNNESVFFR